MRTFTLVVTEDEALTIADALAFYPDAESYSFGPAYELERAKVKALIEKLGAQADAQ